MTIYLRGATVGVAMALMLVGSTVRAQESTGPGVCAVSVEHEQGRLSARAPGFADSTPLWSSAGRQIQLVGKILCTECTLADVRKAHPHIPNTRLYEVKSDQGQMVTELRWTSNPRWQDKLLTPHVVQLRADASLLQRIMTKENRSKELQVSGLLYHRGILYVNEMQVCN